MPHQIPRLTHRVQTRLSWSMRIVWYSKKNHFFPMLSRSPSSHAKVLHSSAILCVWFHRGSPLHEHRTCPDSERSESIFYGSNGLADFWNITQSIPAKRQRTPAKSCGQVFEYCNGPTRKSVHTSGQNSRPRRG